MGDGPGDDRDARCAAAGGHRTGKAARPNGRSALENLVDRFAESFDLELAPDAQATVVQIAHYGLGVVPGAAYGLLRRRAPPEAYPPETHLRGLVGHLVLGVVTDASIDALGG